MITHILLTCPAHQKLAEAIVAKRPEIHLGEINWNRFSDGFPNIFVKNMESLSNCHVSYLACFNSPDTIFEQMSLIYAVAEFRPKSFKILLPYFPTGTMERVDNEGQIATASTLAQMFSAVAPSGPGPVPLYMWDVHALPIRHYFGQNISPKFKTGTKLLKKALEGKDVSLVFPDEGAWKRFHGMFEGVDGKPLYPFVVCRKVRNGEKRQVTVSEGVVADKDVVIVDDLIHSGGTLVECAKALTAAGAKSVSAYVTHGVLEREAWKKFIDAGFANVWITDSCPETAAAVNGVAPFTVLSLADSVTNAVLA